MHVLRHILVALALILLLWSTPAYAQNNDWREVPTDYFVVLYTPGYEAVATEYAGFVDTVYDELAATFNHRTDTPLSIRLYPTLESYQAVNPLARNMPGVVAHADFRRRELVVILPQTQGQSTEGIQNNIRHELAHIVAAELSNNRLNTGFQEGLAQYVEQPTDDLARKIQLLSVVRDQGLLLAWSDFDDRDTIYDSPEISYPQTLSVVAFLVDQYGFGRLREFLTVSARSSGYRSALQRTYDISPADLEEQWRDWLPDYLNGGYLHNALTGYDLSYPRQLLQQGRYAEAQAELDNALELLQSNIDQGTATPQEQAALSEARELEANIQKGQQATTLAQEARVALENGEYKQASQLVEQARVAYTELGDTRQDAVLAAYAERAERGLRAETHLAQARDLSRVLRLPGARANADAAAADFAAIGDADGLEQALKLRHSLNNYQRIGGILLLLLGASGVFLSLLGRYYGRESDVW